MRLFLAIFLLCLAMMAEALPRDRNQVAAFKRAHPCPVNGKTHGACPGYEIDHILPLKCGGADRPGNMQWLTVREHKAKTKREAWMCNKRRGK